MKFFSPTGVVYFAVHFVLLLIGFLLVKAEQAIAQGIGGSLVAAAVAGMIIYVYLHFADRTRRRVEVAADIGLLKAFQRRGPPIQKEYSKLLDKANKQIDIMGFGLRALREDYENSFAHWKSRAKVRILLLDPMAPRVEATFADLRDTEEGNTPGTIRRDVEAFLASASTIIDDRFQIRLYYCIPSLSIFRVDDQLFWGPYLVGTQSRNTPTLLISEAGTLFAPFASQIDEIWNKHSIGAAEWLQKSQN